MVTKTLAADAQSSAGEEAPLIDDDALDFDITPAPTGCVRRPVQNLFLHKQNPRFAISAELAFRGALFLLIGGIPVIIPSGVWELRDNIIKYGIYNSSVCCFIIFNLGRTFGEAFDKVKSGFRGTLLAAVMGWTLYTVWPDGYSKDSPDMDFWLIVSIGVVYVCLVMFFRLDLSFQMFAISNFAGIWMTILNPDDPTTITPPWAGNWSLETDTLLQGLIRTCLGFITVTVVLLFPYPLWALVVVQENQLAMNKNLSQILRMMVKCHCQDTLNLYDKEAVMQLMHSIKAVAGESGPLIESAWWECFGLGRTQLKRQVLFSMSLTSRRVYDLAFNAWTASSAVDQGKRDTDARLMSLVKDQTESVLDGMEQMLNLLVKAAEDGKFDPHEVAAVKACKRKLMTLESALSVHFHAKRIEVTQGRPEAMYKDVRIAQVLQWTISRIVGEVIELADGVSKFSNGEASLPPTPDGEGFWAIFSNLSDKEHVLYALRGIISYLLGFTLGFFGFRQIVPSHSSAIAATAPLLMSMYVGSALNNDMHRIQGLMIGNVISRILRGLVDGCDPSDLVIHAAITFTWVFTGLFVQFHSPSYSTVGVLAAAFGASTLLAESCNHFDSDTVGKRETFDSLAMNCIAVMITMCVDVVFQAERASDKAFNCLDACWTEIQSSLSDTFNPEVKTVTFHSAKAKALLKEAARMGEEANLEPRFWRTFWHQELFVGICRATDCLIIATAALESAIAEHGRDGDVKFDTFVQLSGVTPHNARIGIFGSPESVDVVLKFNEVKDLLRIFVHETVKRFTGDSVQPEDTKLQAQIEQHFIKQTVPKFFGLLEDKPEQKMCHDEMAHLSVVFAARSRIRNLLKTVQHLILASHWEY